MIVAGEVSGDLHGSGVVRELRKKRAGISVFGVGGDLMKKEGMEILHHISRLSVMGFAEVIRHLPIIRRVERSLVNALDERRPDVVVLIDYPGFNLRFAAKVKARGIPILYYITPQIWAWHRSRLRRIRELVDQVNVIFQFEVDLFRKAGIPVEFVGHPLLERLGSTGSKESFLRRLGIPFGKRLISLFPGSRMQELRMILPTMLTAARSLRAKLGVEVAIGVSPGLGKIIAEEFLKGDTDIMALENATYELMEHSDAAVVTSGTATLETGWFGTPMVIVYKTSSLTYALGKMLIRVPHIGLVNIVSGREVVPELLQGRMTPQAIVDAVTRILGDASYDRSVRQQLSELRQKLGTPGASARVADNILALAGTQ
jgi:lipid-A-disaccharide synthase